MKYRFEITSTSCLILLLAVFCSPLQAALQAKVDRQYVYEGESVTLSISTENRTNLPDPDFSPLSKDFDVGGTSESTQISIFNGQRSDRHTWSVRLMPKRLGKVEIPSIQLGQQSTLPLQIEVKPIPVKTGENNNEAVFITLEIDSDSQSFYVQQQIPLVARLYYKYDLTQGQIVDPQADNVLLERLGEDKTYTANHNGQNYRVFERRYSLLAEKSGDLSIPAVKFQGYMSQPQSTQGRSRRSDPFSQFFAPHTALSKGQPISLRSKPLQVTIKPHPTAFNGKYWLPAESVELKDSWTDNPPDFRVGEPVTRVITLSAKGLLASQIQPLELPQISSFRRYAEPPEIENRSDGQSLYASSRRNFTYIPQFAGTQDIPALQIPWWNVLSDQQETAMLPAWQIQVKADPNAAPQSPSAAFSQPVPAQSSSQPNPQTSKQPAQQAETSQQKNDAEQTLSENTFDLLTSVKQWRDKIRQSDWGLSLVILLGLLMLGFLLRYLAQLGRQAAAHNNQPPENLPVKGKAAVNSETLSDTEGLRAAKQAFREACAAHQAEDAARALLMMSMRTWQENPPMSLGALAEKLPEAADLIMQLDRYLYSDKQQAWQGDALCQLLGNGLTKTNKKPSTENQATLKKLYPQAS